MSNEIKPMTVVVVAVMPDGSARMKVEGRSSVADVMLAAKLLELEADHTYQRMKAAQAMESNPRVVGVPAGVIPMNGKG